MLANAWSCAGLIPLHLHYYVQSYTAGHDAYIRPFNTTFANSSVNCGCKVFKKRGLPYHQTVQAHQIRVAGSGGHGCIAA